MSRFDQAALFAAIAAGLIAAPLMMQSGVMTEQSQDQCVESNSEYEGEEAYNSLIGCPLGGIMAGFGIILYVTLPLFFGAYVSLKTYDKAQEIRR